MFGIGDFIDSPSLEWMPPKAFAVFYDVWVIISHHFVVGINTLDMSVRTLYRKYFWAPGTLAPQTILADSM